MWDKADAYLLLIVVAGIAACAFVLGALIF